MGADTLINTGEWAIRCRLSMSRPLVFRLLDGKPVFRKSLEMGGSFPLFFPSPKLKKKAHETNEPWIRWSGTSSGAHNRQMVGIDDLSFTAVVPEPSAALLGALGVLTLLRRKR